MTALLLLFENLPDCRGCTTKGYVNNVSYTRWLKLVVVDSLFLFTSFAWGVTMKFRNSSSSATGIPSVKLKTVGGGGRCCAGFEKNRQVVLLSFFSIVRPSWWISGVFGWNNKNSSIKNDTTPKGKGDLLLLVCVVMYVVCSLENGFSEECEWLKLYYNAYQYYVLLVECMLNVEWRRHSIGIYSRWYCQSFSTVPCRVSTVILSLLYCRRMTWWSVWHTFHVCTADECCRVFVILQKANVVLVATWSILLLWQW